VQRDHARVLTVCPGDSGRRAVRSPTPRARKGGAPQASCECASGASLKAGRRSIGEIRQSKEEVKCTAVISMVVRAAALE
jgi:hypothetical protein